jgi:hypothetical protein
MLMIALLLLEVPCAASARKTSAKVSVVAPKERAPILRKFRRVTPSQ